MSKLSKTSLIRCDPGDDILASITPSLPIVEEQKETKKESNVKEVNQKSVEALFSLSPLQSKRPSVYGQKSQDKNAGQDAYVYSSSAILSDGGGVSSSAPKKSVVVGNVVSFTKKAGDSPKKLLEDRLAAINPPQLGLPSPKLDAVVEPAQVIAPIVSRSSGSVSTWKSLLDSKSEIDLPGEKLVMRIENCVLINVFTDSQSVGILNVTNYKISFLSFRNKKPITTSISNESGQTNAVGVPIEEFSVIMTVPLGSIEKLERFGNQQTTTQYCLNMTTKDARLIRIGFVPALQMRRRVFDCLMQYIFPPKIEFVFAFYHRNKLVIPAECDGWNLYNPVEEFSRLGIPNVQFRLSSANSNFSLCSTYPAILAVPNCISDADLVKIANFRSRGRLPVLSWKSENNVCLFRCAQPNVGINSSRCSEDEFLLYSISQLTREGSIVYIYDARPKLNAVGNQIAGKGYESTSYYKNCEIIFLNIQNIHAVRDSFQKMSKLIQRPFGTQYDDNWLSQVESTEWLAHIRQILNGTFQMVSKIDTDKCSVVSHCSDGWDRTIQLVTLCELCLDPFYRTLRGFCVLVEKEWLSYGHMFQERCGHAEENLHDQRAPIFQQWLECVYNLIHQFPTAFEITSRFLMLISEHLYSCRFGTFLYNSPLERQNASVITNSVSLWTYVLNYPEISKLANPLFDPIRNSKSVLYPSFSAKTIVVWPDFWYRYLPHEMIGGSYGPRSFEYESMCSIENSQCEILQSKMKAMQEELEHLRAENIRLLSSCIECVDADVVSNKSSSENTTINESKDAKLEDSPEMSEFKCASIENSSPKNSSVLAQIENALDNTVTELENNEQNL